MLYALTVKIWNKMINIPVINNIILYDSISTAVKRSGKIGESSSGRKKYNILKGGKKHLNPLHSDVHICSEELNIITLGHY